MVADVAVVAVLTGRMSPTVIAYESGVRRVRVELITPIARFQQIVVENEFVTRFQEIVVGK